MNDEQCLVTVSSVLEDITDLAAGWGWLDLRVLPNEGLAAVEAYIHGRHFNSTRCAGKTRELPEHHRLHTAKIVPQSAVWYRGRPEVPFADMHRFMARRPHSAYPVARFRELISQGWIEPSTDGVFYALVEDRSNAPHRWTAWDLAGGEAVPAHLMIYDAASDPSSVYAGHWPLEEFDSVSVAVVGVGSIGSAAAVALAEYEVRNIILIDNDRLQPHNIPRHRCGYEDIGRYKVDAVADLIRSRSRTSVDPLRMSVIEHADFMRPLFDDVDIVICCADGVAARQATSHLCSMSSTSAVFACVLEDGALGELVRDPARSDVGCLRCLRTALEASGSMDPEPELDLEYGTGTTHRPMTAIGGDLALMGQLAAKVAVATILERRGYRDQRLSSNHIIIGLRPDAEWVAPFDRSRVLDVGLGPVPVPDPDCPLCSGDHVYT